MAKAASINRENAESLAIEALAFLAQDGERLERFLAISGIDPQTIRRAADDPGFLAGVLDHIAADEALLLAFAQHADVEPVAVARAHAMLSGPRREREVS